MRSHEVVVVGAGPAGSVAATILAQAGRDVLLLDRTTFPRDKSCGDFVPREAMQLLLELGLGDALRSDRFYPVRDVAIVSPGLHATQVPLRAKHGADWCMIPRETFDTLLWEHACRSGAQFEVLHVEAPLIERGIVTGVRGRNDGPTEIRAQVVIAGDGATSAIARALRGAKSPDIHRAVAVRAYAEDLDLVSHRAEFHFTRALLPFYGWVFPVGDRCANVGVGIRLDRFRRGDTTVKRLLDDFLALPHIAARFGAAGRVRDPLVWQLNFGSEDFPRVYDGALLAGDAGGFISPLTGAGIHNAMITGELAARAAIAALEARDRRRNALAEFEGWWRRRLRARLRAGFWLQRQVAESAWRMDRLVRLLAGLRRDGAPRSSAGQT
jgi:geranylgeranyl reductase family protein